MLRWDFLCFHFFSRQSCNPLVLFEAEIEKYCPENFVDIKVGSFKRHMALELNNHKIIELNNFCISNALEFRDKIFHQIIMI